MKPSAAKTAKLFESAAQLGPVISGRVLGGGARPWPITVCHLGTAFQLIDDVLDYSADAGQLGKNIGDDLAEGKPTLPVDQCHVESGPAEQALY